MTMDRKGTMDDSMALQVAQIALYKTRVTPAPPITLGQGCQSWHNQVLGHHDHPAGQATGIKLVSSKLKSECLQQES